MGVIPTILRRSDSPRRPHEPARPRYVREIEGSRPLRGHPARLQRRGCRPAQRLPPHRAHARRARRAAALGTPAHAPLPRLPWRAHGQSGDADGARGSGVYLSLGLAGGSGCQSGGPGLSRSEPLSRELGSRSGEAHQPGARARRSDPDHGRQGRYLLVRAHHRRRRGGFRRAAQRLRAHEGDDRGGGRGRPLRGPACFREEVRPPGWQGAGAHAELHPHAQRRAARRRRLRHLDFSGCAHGRRERAAHHVGHRRA